MKIGSHVRYRGLWCIVHGFTSTGLVTIWDGVQSYTVRRERLKRGKQRSDKGRTR